MYDSALGRFIQQDSYKGDIKNPQSLNLYTYCLNNPIKFYDPDGHDAIVITNQNSVAGFGHTSVLLQDKKSDWYYYYWGEKVLVEKIDDKNALADMKGLNKWLDAKGEGSARYYKGDYTTSVYIKGDFDKSVNHAIDLRDEYNKKYYGNTTKLPFKGSSKKNYNGDYHLLNKNCIESVYDALKEGKLADGTSFKDVMKENSALPNYATMNYYKLFLNTAYTKEEYTKQVKNYSEKYIKNQEKSIDIIKNTKSWQFWKDHYGETTKTYEDNIKDMKKRLKYLLG